MSPAPLTPKTLYAIEDELLAYLNSVEMIPDDEPGLRSQLEEQIAQLLLAERNKVDAVNAMLAHFESQAELAAAEIKRLQDRKKSFEGAYERLEECAKLAMELAGIRKLEGHTSTLSIRACPASVLIRDFEKVPIQYKIIKTETSIDKEAVKRALKAGADVPGATPCEGKCYLVRR